MKYGIWVLFFALMILGACTENTDGTGINTSSDHHQEQENEQTGSDGQTTTDQNKNEPEKNEQTDQQEADAPAEPQYKINAETSSVVPIDDANEKVVLLTFDDAPDEYALEMANTLKSMDANAIFFINGHFLESTEGQNMLKKIDDMGFVIGNHTYNHSYLPDLSKQEQKDQIVRLNDTIEDIIGKRPQFFRPPNGANTDFTKKLAEQEGMVSMNWTYGYDYFEPYMDTEKIKEAMISGKGPEVDVPYSLLKPGANLLMHDREWTAAALEEIVTGLRDKGYKIVDPTRIQTIE
ncbi:polysaccharide deacetylase family protein [Lentibacillus cibarius]|nr:polysaccharide deacetylase family protein [Lentibacillus cibarius]